LKKVKIRSYKVLSAESLKKISEGVLFAAKRFKIAKV
jgi:hypothetical protein